MNFPSYYMTLTYSTTQNCRNFKEIESSRRVHKRLMPIMKYSGRCDQWNICSSYVHTITRRKKFQNVLPLFFPCKVSLSWCPLVSFKSINSGCSCRLWTLHLNYHMRLNGRTTTFWPAFFCIHIETAICQSWGTKGNCCTQN